MSNTIVANSALLLLLLPQGLSGHLVEVIALLLLPVAIGMCGYAIFIFIWRSQMISKKRVRGTCTQSCWLIHVQSLSYTLLWHVEQARTVTTVVLCI